MSPINLVGDKIRNVSPNLCHVKHDDSLRQNNIRQYQTGQCQIFVQQMSAHCSVLFLSRPRSEVWPHHGRTFSIYLCPLSFWLTLPQRVLSTTWCCLSRPCMVFLACVHLALFLALFLSPGNSFVSSWCDHSMPASLHVVVTACSYVSTLHCNTSTTRMLAINVSIPNWQSTAWSRSNRRNCRPTNPESDQQT